MTHDNEQFESLKSKLQKLQALAERGCQGEANNARRAIERICQQYGVKLEEVLDIETKHAYTFEIGRNKEMMNLFIRCLCSVCDISGMTYTQPTRSAIRIELTALQYADISSLFNWHKANYKREFDDFKRSFSRLISGNIICTLMMREAEAGKGKTLRRRIWSAFGRLGRYRRL